MTIKIPVNGETEKLKIKEQETEKWRNGEMEKPINKEAQLEDMSMNKDTVVHNLSDMKTETTELELQEKSNVTEPQQSRLEELEKLNKEYLEHLRRLQAEFDNFRKRSRKEREDTIKYSNEQLLLNLLPSIDNLQRAISLAEPSNSHIDKSFLEGIKLVEKQISDVFANFGISPFESVGKTFDPVFHEALACIETSETPENIILEEFQKGYTIHEKVLRPAKVSIVKQKPNESEKNF